MNGLTSPTTKQHFVPRFYLRRFLNENGEVEVLDCAKRQILAPKGPKGLCYKDFFYGINTGQADDISQHIEAGFGQLENRIARDLGPIISKVLKIDHILDTEKWTLALLMSMLWIRGPAMRYRVNDLTEQATKGIIARHFGSQYADNMFDRFDRDSGTSTPSAMREEIKKVLTTKQYSLHFNNEQHLMMFEDINIYANLFWRQHWTLLISRVPQRFVTSDTPVVVRSPKRTGLYPPTFLERTHYLSLTPEICIKASHPKNDSGKKTQRRTLFRGREVEVLDVNAIIAGKALEYVYATERQSLEDILALMKSQEEFFATPEGQTVKKMLEQRNA